MLSLTIDGFIVYYGAFSFVLPWSAIFSMTMSFLLISYFTIFIDMAFLYIMVSLKKNRIFGIDDRKGQVLKIQTLEAYDTETNS